MPYVKQLLTILKENAPNDSDGLDSIQFKLLKAHIQWTAVIGDTKRSFLVKYALGLLLSPLAFWVGYISPLGLSLDELTGFASAFGWLLYIPGLLLPPGVVVLTLVALATHMFTDEFWQCVAVARSEQTAGACAAVKRR